MKAIQTDTLLKNAEFLIGRIRSLQPVSSQTRAVFKILTEWDCRAEEGLAPYLFYRFERWLAFNIFSNRLSTPRLQKLISASWLYRLLGYPSVSAAADFAFWLDDPRTPAREGWPDVVEKSLRNTHEEWQRETKNIPEGLRWESVHTLEYNHPLGSLFFLKPFFNRGPFPVKGGSGSVLTTGFRRDSDFSVVHLSTFRMILDFTDHFSRSLLVNSSGQSGHFLSPFYDDQIALFTGQHYRLMDELGKPSWRLRLLPDTAR